MNTELHLLRREAVEHPTGELRREDLGHNGAGDEHGGHHGDDDGECFLRVLLALFREKAGIDGDERDRSGAAGHDVVEPVGQSECSDVGVGLLPGTESVGDVGLADVSDYARERDGAHQQQRRREGGVLVRWAEKAQQTHPSQINASCGWWESYWRGSDLGRQSRALRQRFGTSLVCVITGYWHYSGSSSFFQPVAQRGLFYECSPVFIAPNQPVV